MKTIPYGHQSIYQDDIKEAVKVLKSDWITQGSKIEEFQRALCDYTGAKYAVAVSSGTAALHIASLAAGIKAGDELITSPVTFVASANCALYCQAKPVFADVDYTTINIDPLEIKKKITRKTKAIIPVHFAGYPCDLTEISKIAKDNGLIVIEDAAHALGAEYRGSKIGSCRFSDMTIFSFHPVKSITTGEGGAVLTNSKVFFEKLLRLRNHGIEKNPKEFKNKSLAASGEWYYEMQDLGFNYRITDFQSALGIGQLKKADKFIARRRKIAFLYKEAFAGIGKIILPQEKSIAKSAWHIFYIRLKNSSKRKPVFDKLRMAGIGVQVHYIPVYRHPYYCGLGYRSDLCLNAEKYYKSAITLPIYPKMDAVDISRVIETTKKVLSNT